MRCNYDDKIIELDKIIPDFVDICPVIIQNMEDDEELGDKLIDSTIINEEEDDGDIMKCRRSRSNSAYHIFS